MRDVYLCVLNARFTTIETAATNTWLAMKIMMMMMMMIVSECDFNQQNAIENCTRVIAMQHPRSIQISTQTHTRKQNISNFNFYRPKIDHHRPLLLYIMYSK